MLFLGSGWLGMCGLTGMICRFAYTGSGTFNASDCAGNEEVYQWVGHQG